MNAPAKILAGKTLENTIWLLETRALIRAYLEYEHQYERLADAVDPLQEFAEDSGLVAAIGQDQVQQLIAKPFERFRAIVAAEVDAEERAADAELEAEPDQLTDYDRQEISRRIQRWEAADVQWPAPAPARHAPYHPAKSTVAAFFHVLSIEDPESLAKWLADHPRDAVHLQTIWERKCSRQTK